MRKYIKLTTFTAVGALLLLTAAVFNGIRAHNYARQVENDLLRAANGLAESVCAVDIGLHKCICAGTPEGYAAVAAELWGNVQRGKVYAGELSGADGSLEGLEKFLSQAGDYAVCAAKGEELTEEQYDCLRELSERACSLRLSLEEFLSAAEDERLSKELWNGLSAAAQQVSSEVSIDSLIEDDRVLVDMPSLVYDGAFSDHIFSRSPALLEKMECVDSKNAGQTAERVLGRRVYSTGESTGVIEEFIFSDEAGTSEIAVTKHGGVVSYMLRDVKIREQLCPIEEAELSAQRFLRSLGLKDFVRVQYSTWGGRCVFSFAPQQDGIILYPDQVKVGVALDCGDVISFDGREYIMNHRDRGILTAGRTCLEAQARVSDMLTVTDSRLVLTVSDGMKERLCYEFLCRRWDGGEAVVYINADSLAEERIYLLSRTDDSYMVV